MWLFRNFFAFLDQWIYILVDIFYNLLLDISRTNIFNETVLAAFSDRIYAFLGIFMLFKMSFSLIKYIINPDEFSDSKIGGKKMLMNSIIVLILIVTTPFIFTTAYSLQGYVIDENVIPKVILGVSDSPVSTNDAGKNISKMVLTAFYYPNCGTTSGDVFQYVKTDDENGFDIELIEGCDFEDKETYLYAYKNGDIRGMFFSGLGGDFVTLEKNGDYVFNYMILISTIAGGAIALIFFVFCFDIALRMVKLGFLQLIAPIPIVSYIDPKSGKDGMFSKWVKECIKTYLSLFIRLAAVFFGVFIISLLNIPDNQNEMSMFVKVFIIFGTLLFAKQLPKLIEDMTGLKFDGFTLNPMNRIRQTPVLGNVVSGAIGAGIGGFTGFKEGVKASEGLKGTLFGAAAGWRAATAKVPITGAKKGDSNPKVMSSAMQEAGKLISGNEFKIRSWMDYMPHGRADQRIDELKEQREIIQKAQYDTELSLDLKGKKITSYQENIREVENRNDLSQTQKETMINEYTNKINELMSAAQDDKNTIFVYSKDIGTINDQIKDIERFNRIDESTSEKLKKVENKVKGLKEKGYKTDKELKAEKEKK